MKKLVAALAVLAFAASAALAASAHFVKVSPSSVKRGKTVRVYGTVTACPKAEKVILTSKAFKGSTTHSFAGVPAILASQNTHHKFSVHVTIKVKKGSYHIGGRCGGGHFGGTTLKVT
jgi:uncharacterized GH25 family protein